MVPLLGRPSAAPKSAELLPNSCRSLTNLAKVRWLARLFLKELFATPVSTGHYTVSANEVLTTSHYQLWAEGAWMIRKLGQLGDRARRRDMMASQGVKKWRLAK